MTDDNFKVHVEDILNLLKDKEDVDRDKVEEELKKFMEYGVPIDQAKQTLLKKYGGNIKFSSSDSGSSERRFIADLKPNERSVNLLGRIIAINPKEITVKGEKKQIFYGILGDESGTIPFTSWEEVDVEKGDIIEINNAYTREWQGEPQLNFGDRVSIKKADEDSLPKDAFKPKNVKVKSLRSGIGTVDVTAKILELKERETEINGDMKKIFSGVIADETGKAQFTSWHDFKLKKDQVFNISGGYVKSWKGIPQLTFDQNAKVKKIDKSKFPKGISNFVKIRLFELVEKRGGLDFEVEGTVIEIRPGSGYVVRCPECNRVLQNNECSIHGSVKGVDDLRVKLFVDDGTGAVSSVLNREFTENILGKTMDECKEMDENKLADEINKVFFAKRICLRGNALGDEFGTSVIPKEACFVDVDIQKEAERISENLEDLL